MRHQSFRILLLTAVVLAGLHTPARATMFGQTVNADLVLGGLVIDQGNVVVGAGSEWPNILSVFDVDLSSASILITILQNQTLPGDIDLVFNDALSTIPAFVSGSLVSSDVLGFSQTNISSTADSITLLFDGLAVSAGDQILVNVNIPEPATGALVAGGLLAIALLRRSRRA